MGCTKIIKVGDRSLDLSGPVVMTILNVTPDSFWEGSRNHTDSNIKKAVEKAVQEGASIIDIGGYSSRPGAEEVTAEEEYLRVARGFAIVREVAPSMVVSIDTFRSRVVKQAIEEFGPCIVNDISAGELDPQMIPLVAELGVPYNAMHMRGTPADMQSKTSYGDVTREVRTYFEKKIESLAEAGIKEIIIDPGFGFAKTTEQNYELMGGMNQLVSLGFPLLVGVSRKSMIYKVLGATPADSLSGTVALNWECLRQGASILRVHDTKAAADVVKLFNYYKQAYGSND